MMKLNLTLLSLIIVLGSALEAQAVLDLSVSPFSGGNNLRFGRVSSGGQVNQEVRIRITSTDGNQYQVFHRMVDSFLNEKNETLGSDAISTYTLLGSNASGTLYAQNIERMGFTDQLLYSSGSGGESDSFTAVYAVDGRRVAATGNFFGRIQYTIRPVGGASQNTAILNVTIETSGELKINVEGSSAVDAVRLKFKGGREKEGYVRVSFKNNLGQEIQVFQEVEPFPQDVLFSEINDRVVLFSASGSSKGELSPTSLSGLTRKRTQVYSSRESDDTFLLNFILNEDGMEQQKAGAYKGQLNYIVKAGQDEQVFNIQLEIDVEPVFTIQVDLPPQGLSFERLLPDSQPELREVGVEVKTNLGRPYMVIQNVVSPLTSDKGTVMPEQYFTFKQELFEGQAGKVGFDDFSQISTGETSIYFSDNKGSAVRFHVIYRLKPYPAMVAGDYTTSIRYSLGEI